MGKTRKQRQAKGPDPTQAGDSMELCGAKTRKGTPCGRTAGWGTGHAGTGKCRNHGGSSPNAEVAGAVELATREAVVMGQPLDVEPHELILRCIRITAGEIAYCTVQIQALKNAMVSTMFGPQIHTWITVRQRAMERGVMFSATALKAGVEERQIRVAERAGEMMAELIRGVLTDLGIPLGDPKTREVVTRHLALIEGGAPA